MDSVDEREAHEALRRRKHRFLYVFMAFQAIVVIGSFFVIWRVMVGIDAMIETEQELRDRLTTGNGLEQIEAWAQAAMTAHKPDGHFHDVAVTAAVQAYGIRDGIIIDDGYRSAPYVSVEFGGGFHHYGLLIGPTGFTPESNDWERYSQWTETVWYREQTQ